MKDLCFDTAVDGIWFPVDKEDIALGPKGRLLLSELSDLKSALIGLNRKKGAPIIGLTIPIALVRNKGMVFSEIGSAPNFVVDVFLTLSLKQLVPNHLSEEEMEKYCPTFLNPLIAVEEKKGSCYEKVSVMAAIAKANGLKARIVGCREPAHFWIEIQDALTREWRALDSDSGYRLSKLRSFEFQKIICYDASFKSFAESIEKR